MPDLAILTCDLGVPDAVPSASICFTMSMPSTTSPAEGVNEGTSRGRERGRTEDNVRAVEPAGDDGGDEELGAVRVLAGVRHGEDTRLGVLELEVLVCSRSAYSQLSYSFPQHGRTNAPANFSP